MSRLETTDSTWHEPISIRGGPTYTTMFQSIRQHRWDRVSREVQALTGRTPTHLSELL